MKKFAIILSALTAAVVAWSPAVFAQSQTVALSAPDLKATSGSQVRVPIAVSGGSGVGALHIELTFDPAVLQPISVEKGKVAPPNTLLDSSATSGRYVIGLVSSDKVTSDGEIVVAKFKVLGKRGAKSDLGLDKLRSWEGSVDRFEFKVTGKQGTFTVGGGSSFPWWIIVVAALVIAAGLIYARSRSAKKHRRSPPLPPALAHQPHREQLALRRGSTSMHPNPYSAATGNRSRRLSQTPGIAAVRSKAVGSKLPTATATKAGSTPQKFDEHDTVESLCRRPSVDGHNWNSRCHAFCSCLRMLTSLSSSRPSR